jgi:hypothetical protein
MSLKTFTEIKRIFKSHLIRNLGNRKFTLP